ncbi:MAG: hypothetical protein GY907_07760, partial [Bacteroidetes bacterium]|nr:hypothetical protein [Bacteroidota bacterium]
MGLSSSPKIFTDFMHFPIWAIKHDKPALYYQQVHPSLINLKDFRKDSDIIYDPSRDRYYMANIFYYMDDILGGHLKKKTAWKQFEHSEKILKKLGLPTKAAKARFPDQCQKWLGKIYDTNKQWIKLESEKVEKYCAYMRTLIQRKWITKRELLSVIGRTRHMASIYRSLSAFARSLEIFACSWTVLDEYVKMTKYLKRDLELCIWAMKRADEYGVSFDFYLQPINKPDVICYTDASAIGIGGITNRGQWFQNKWSDIYFPGEQNRDNLWRELCAVFVVIASLRKMLRHKIIHVYTDNEPVKWMLISMRSKLYRPDLQYLINRICRWAIKFEFNLWIEHIPGVDNVIADALSRYKSQPFGNLTSKYTYKLDSAPELQFGASLC